MRSKLFAAFLLCAVAFLGSLWAFFFIFPAVVFMSVTIIGAPGVERILPTLMIFLAGMGVTVNLLSPAMVFLLL